MRILVVASRFPYPLNKGDRLRLYHQIKFLSQQHEVVLLSLDDEPVEDAYVTKIQEFCSQVICFPLSKKDVILNSLWGVLRGIPLNVAYFTSRHKVKKVREIIAQLRIDHIYVQLIRAVEYVKGIENIPMSIDYMDAFSLRIRRKLNHQSWLKPLWKWEQRKLLSYEKKAQKYFSKRFVISRVDQLYFENNAIRNTILLPNGVDTAYFHPKHEIQHKYDFVFVGNLSYQPNIEAVLVIARLAQKMSQDLPSLKVLVAGSNPNKKVLSCQSSYLDIQPNLEDIRSAYWSAPVLLAPIFLGSGMQNKILEALACGLICITTTQVIQALDTPKGLLIPADTEEEFLTQMQRNYRLDRSNKLPEMGVAFVRDQYSWDKSNQALQFE